MLIAPLLLAAFVAAPSLLPAPLHAATQDAARDLVARHGEPERAAIERGVRQVAEAWRPADGDARALRTFLVANYLPEGPDRDATFHRLEAALEQLDGAGVETSRELSRWAVLDLGPMLPVDRLLSAFEPSAHLGEDLFATKLAFVALLHFPLTTLEERLQQGATWSSRRWAEVRLASRFEARIPGEVEQAIARAGSEASLYIADYNLFMHHVLSEKGERLFPKGKRLLSHWNLRDELKAQYAQADGLARQRVIARALERIVDQTIPAAVVNEDAADWNPWSNAVRPAPPETVERGTPAARVDEAREPDTRYARILATFRANRLADPFTPRAPTFIARRFEWRREIPEARFRAMLEAVLGSPEVRRVAEAIRHRLGRPLEPFDVWYDGFRPRARHGEAELDGLTRARYPTPAAFARDLPAILGKVGFSPEKAAWLAEHIEVDPARGSGHALPAGRRGDHPHLRTRVGPDGMDYKGFNIAVHELGHNVEEVFSLYRVDSTLLQGVPNTAFTEAIAFVFQARDLEVLGLEAPDAEARRLLALNDLWMTYEIAGVGLVDMEIWHWMYRHPEATPAALRQATLEIARDVWNRWFAPVLGVKDSTLLACYSHMVSSPLYLPDYALGHLIAAQIEDHLAHLPPGRRLGDEVERMTSLGAVTPDVWMRNATGAPVSTEALLAKARAALDGGAP
jgi:hypothetical protein